MVSTPSDVLASELRATVRDILHPPPADTPPPRRRPPRADAAPGALRGRSFTPPGVIRPDGLETAAA